MRKFKLIKLYPGSPSLKTPYEEIKGRCGNGSGRMYKNLNKDGCCIDAEDIENNPEYWEEIVEYPIGTKVYNSQTKTIYTKKEDGWYKPAEKTAYTDEMIGSRKYLTVLDKEEVIEKDYEILSFKRGVNIYTVRENGRLLWDIPEYKGMNADITATHWTEATKKGYIIHSVKRLSDGEVFTVGDKVRYNFSKSCLSLKITKIAYESVGKTPLTLYIYTENGSQSTINNYVKAKLPLFTTEDGVDIFEDTTVYGVNSSWLIFSHFTDLKEKIKYWGNKPIFSTEEAAEEYILMNKPCLTINDVNEVFLIDKSSIKMEKLKHLVKEK